MATAMKPAMPPVFSDDFGRALYRETRDQVPAEQRTTCPVHFQWRDHCRDLH